MNRREFQIGPGAASLMLIAVVLSLSVLSVLSLVSAKGDADLSRRSLSVAEISAALNDEAERALAQLDALLASCSDAEDDGEYLDRVAEALPDGMALDGRTVSWTETGDGGRMMECAVELSELGDFPRAAWAAYRQWTELGDDDAWD